MASNVAALLFSCLTSLGGGGGIPGNVTDINLSATDLSDLGAQNAGATIAIITITGTQGTALVVGGTDAAYFTTDNGGMAPCNLLAAIDIPAGSYSINLTAT